jgi:hypothetical protein
MLPVGITLLIKKILPYLKLPSDYCQLLLSNL